MSNSVQVISLARLSLAFIPVAAVVAILNRWSLDYKNALYGVSRMLLQLLLVGYFLNTLFAADRPSIILVVLAVMIFAASWIALRTVSSRRRRLYGRAFVSISVGGGMTLALITGLVLQLQPWYLPSYMIPLAGMIFANAMNSVSLAAERLTSEVDTGAAFEAARAGALRTALIPLINTLFAVGLVSLPGMMTGQILSGISPLVAARYQIMVMCMVFGAAGISSAIFLKLVEPDFR